MKIYIKLIIILMIFVISFYATGCNGKGITPSYTVTYIGNGSTGGTVPVDSTFYEKGDTVTILGNTGSLVNTGSFQGWSCTIDGKSLKFTQGQTFVMGTQNVKLSAMWHITTYILRETGPAGGLIFYDKGSYSNGWRFLETAPNGENGSVTTERTNIEWGSSGISIGGTLLTLGAGKNNTALINAALVSAGETGRASQICTALLTGGYTDWFLPSKGELDKIYVNLRRGTNDDNGLATYTPVIGSWGTDYWSSSEDSSANAWSENLSSGVQTSSTKISAYTVRAVRAF